MVVTGKTLLDLLSQNLGQKELLKLLLQEMVQSKTLTAVELQQLYEQAQGQETVPLSIFSTDLYPLEALCKFLREERQYSNTRIASILRRSAVSLSAAYSRAQRKHPAPFVPSTPATLAQEIYLPLSIFTVFRLTPLESIILYLKKIHHFSNKQIALFLHKSHSSIAVVAKKAQQKRFPKNTA